MKPHAIEAHRGFFVVVTGLFALLQVASVLVLWSVDPRQRSPLFEAARVTGLASFVGLLALWWLLRRGAPRLASICLASALGGIVCSMLLPAIP